MIGGLRDLSPLVGRVQELRLLADALGHARRGRGGLVLLSGEPGIGKTRLLDELQARARTDGWRILAGRAYGNEGLPPYLPLAEALRDYFRSCPIQQLRTQLGDHAEEVAMVAPDVRRRLRDLPERSGLAGEYGRYHLFEAVSDFLLDVARASPDGLLLVLDDLHWADEQTLLWLLHFARRLGAAGGDAPPLLVAGAYRTVDLGRSHPLSSILADLNRERLAERLTLAPLSLEESGALIEQLTGVAVSPPTVDALARQTEGNPFFLEELVRQILAEGKDLGAPGTGVMPWSVPDGLREVIGRRLSRLQTETLRLLQIGAALGDGFRFELAAHVSGATFQVLVDALEEAVSAGVLREEDGSYTFTHALIRQAVYGELSGPRRALLHAKCGEAIERAYAANLDPYLGELARHFSASGTEVGREKAIRYGVRGAERALAQLAYEQGAALYQLALQCDALREQPDAALRCNLLLLLGDAQRRAGELQAALESFEQAAARARKQENADLLARATLGFEEAFLQTGRPRFGASDRSVAIQEEALRALPPAENALRARVTAALGRASYFAGLPERGRSLVAEATSIARRTGDSSALAYALNAQRMAIWGPDDLTDRLEVVTELIDVAEAIGDRELSLDGRQWRLRALFEGGDIDALDRDLAAYEVLAAELREPLYRADVERWHVARAVMEGRFAQAEAAAKRALAIGEPVNHDEAVRAHTAQLFSIRRAQGDTDGLRETITAAERIAANWGVGWHAILADAYLATGRLEQARHHLDAVAIGGLIRLDRDWLWLFLMSRLANVATALGDVELCRTLYRLLQPYANQNVTEICSHGPVARYLGLLAEAMRCDADAVGHYERALALDRRFGSRPQTALTWHVFGRMLLRSERKPERERGRRLVEQALACDAELGMSGHAIEAAALLAGDTAAVPERSLAVGYPDGLTEREVEILRLLAAGHDNETIASELVLSVRTVERHISNLYGKIGAHGRVARAVAVAYAVTHRLVPSA